MAVGERRVGADCREGIAEKDRKNIRTGETERGYSCDQTGDRADFQPNYSTHRQAGNSVVRETGGEGKGCAVAGTHGSGEEEDVGAQVAPTGADDTGS